MYRAFVNLARILVIIGIFVTSAARAETPAAGDLLRDIQHLQVVGSVLYVAAHPDDENTALLGWLVGGRGVRTGYLSMTRGGGGQNLIGSEQSELLGVVRTGELLAARSVDGAEQYFTRMRDFGYSRSADETLSTWGHDEALADVVRAVRTFRPDVILTRFDTTGRTHGHHLASAILAGEAFAAAADPERFPTPDLEPWQADRLLRNQSHWRIDEDTDTSAWLQVDVGTYDPLLGRSYGEIAAQSRSMHKSQGFGSAPRVGPRVEYLAPVAGTGLTPEDDLFTGLDLTWRRFPGTGRLIRALETAERRFDPRAPHTVLPHLARAHALMAEVPDPHWRAVKTAELERVMADCAGLWLTARADRAAVAPGGELTVTLTALARNPAELTLDRVTLTSGHTVEGAPLQAHAPWTTEVDLTVPGDQPPTRPHWLVEAPTPSRYTISDEPLRTAADTPASLRASFDLTIAGRRVTLERPVTWAWTDPVAGERMHPVEVLPPVTATFDQQGVMLPADAKATARLTLRADTGPAAGILRLDPPEGATVTPSEVPFELAEGGEQVVKLRLSATPGSASGPLTATAEVDGRVWALQQAVIDHPHLPRRTVLSPSALQLVPVDLDRGHTLRVGYLPGSGDSVPEALRAVGYQVEALTVRDLAAGALSHLDAIVMGIRAYNTHPRLLDRHGTLMDWVESGGRLIVQYNTNNRFNPLDGPIGPYEFHISRERVTDETAEMTPVDPEHPALLQPNRLESSDFDGWVQERGLYFADSWDPAYQTLFSAHDPGEDPLEGSTLIARHGDGVFVYTGLSFFRQLPAGVPGAYRLFANLLAL